MAFLRGKHAVFLILVALTAPGPLAHAQSLTIQGKVTDGSGNPITGTATEFRVQILAPDAARCVLFDETHTLNLSTSNGLFSINLANGSGTANLPTTYSLVQAVSNASVFAVNATYCASGSGTLTYDPDDDDNRKVVIQFRDPATMTGWETIPEMDLNPMAYAMESRTVNGFPASSLLRVVGGGVPGTAPTLTAAEATELQALVGGTSTRYMARTAANGAQLPSYPGNPTTPNVGSVWYDSTSGSMKFYDGSTVQTLGTSSASGDITGVTAGTGLTGGGASGAVTLSLDTSGVSAASYGSASAVPVLTVDAYGRITAASTASITGTLPSGTTGQFLKSGGGSSWAGASITMGDLKSTIGGLDLFSSPGCTAAQSMYWDSGTDQIKCQAIALNASAITAGQLDIARGGTGAATASQNFVFAGPATGGAGAPAFRALTAADLPAGSSPWDAATGGINYAGGNVGIGTTAPASKLQITGGSATFDSAAGIVSTNGASFKTGPGGLTWSVQPGPSNTANIFIAYDYLAAPKFTIDPLGYVGIGTTAPERPLHVNGSILLENNNAIQAKTSGAAIYGLLLPGGDDATVLSSLGNGITFTSAAYSQELVRITEGGTVGIGTTSPRARLHVLPVMSGTGTGTSIFLDKFDNNEGGDIIYSDNTNSWQNDIHYGNFRFNMMGPNGGSFISTPFYIENTGRVGIGTTHPESALDLSTHTDALALPKGNDAARPGTPIVGMIRWNTATPGLEVYNGTAWVAVAGGAGSYLSSSGGTLSGALTISSGGASVTGGIDNNSGGITEAGSITGVGTNITGTSYLVVAAGGTNQAATLRSSGSGQVNLATGNGNGFAVIDAAGTVANHLTARGATAGNGPILGVSGTDANINLTITPKGTGNTIFSSGNVGIGVAAPAAGLHVYRAASGTLPASSGTTDTTMISRPASAGVVGLDMGILQNGNTWIQNRNATDFSINYPLLLNPNGGFVGIGTTNPSSLFDIWSTSPALTLTNPSWLGSSATAKMNFVVGGSATERANPIAAITAIDRYSQAGETGYSGALTFATKTADSLAERMRISAIGNVGIGTTSPLSILHLRSSVPVLFNDGIASAPHFMGRHVRASSGASQTNDLLSVFGSSGYTGSAYSGTSAYMAMSAAENFSGTAHGTDIIFVTTDTGSVSTSAAERLRITASGKVGIGTTTPLASLHVKNSSGLGTTIESSGTEANLNLVSTSAGGKYWRLASGGSGGSFSGGKFGIWDNDNSAPRLTIDSAGNVGIGTITPGTTLQVAGIISPSVDNNYTLGTSALRFSTVYATTGTINTSDERQKREVLDSDLGLSFLRKLRPVSYYWKQGDQEQHYGLIAQETERVLRREKTSSVPTGIVSYDPQTDRYGIRYGELIAPIIKAIHELSDQIFGTEEKIKVLQAENERLKATSSRLENDSAEKSRRIESLEARLERLERALGESPSLAKRKPAGSKP